MFALEAVALLTVGTWAPVSAVPAGATVPQWSLTTLDGSSGSASACAMSRAMSSPTVG